MNTDLRIRSRPASLVVALALLAGAGASFADDLRDGRTALQAGRYDEALQMFEKAASQGYAEGRAGVGQVYLRRRQYAKALEAFQLAHKMDNGLPMAYYGQGEVLRRQGKCDEAVPLLQKANELDRKFPEAALALGDCLILAGKHEQAVAALTPGINWGMRWRPRFLVALGDAELARDSLRDAGIWYTRAREESPDDAAPRRALGDFYMKRGTFELAVPEYQAALEKDTSDVDLRYRLGRALFAAQRYQEALTVYREVVDRDPEFAPGQYALGDLLYRSGQADRRRYAEARPYLENYVRMAPNDAKGWSVLGRDLAQIGDNEPALEAMNKAEQLGDKTKELFTLRARVQAGKKNWDAALADFDRGEPQPEDLMRIAQIQDFKGNTARAETLYTALLSADASNGNAKLALIQLGKMRFRNKDYAGALEFFEKRNALDPPNDESYYYMGLSHKELKQYPEALAALRKSASLADTRADRWFWYGILLAQVDSTDGARRVFQRSVDLDSAGTNKNTAIALRQLGYYDLRDKAWDTAIRKLERSVEISGQDVQTLVWLGQAYQNAGNRTKACEAYRRALQMDPGQRDALNGKKVLDCP